MMNKDEMDELREFIGGDDAAFTTLVNRYKERIFLAVLRIVRNREEAKDLAQEAFVKAYYNRQSFRAESGFYTWVYRIAVNLSLNYVNRNRDRLIDSLDDVSSPNLTVNPRHEFEEDEFKSAVDQSINKLPARQRTVFILRHYEQKSHAEIASLLSITEGAVKANYHLAVQKLKGSLDLYLKEGRLLS
jgi:RNA polymerase sigma-70 factor (ECF subfamily)